MTYSASPRGIHFYLQAIIIGLAFFAAVNPASACRKIKDDTVNRQFIFGYIEVKENERCELSYSLEDGEGHLNFKQVNYSNVSAPESINLTFNNSNPKIFKFSLVSRQVGTAKFSFSEDVLYWDNQRYSFGVTYEVTTIPSNLPAPKKASIGAGNANIINQNSRIDGVRVYTICDGALTADRQAFDKSDSAKFYLKKALSAKLSVKQCQMILAQSR